LGFVLIRTEKPQFCAVLLGNRNTPEFISMWFIKQRTPRGATQAEKVARVVLMTGSVCYITDHLPALCKEWRTSAFGVRNIVMLPVRARKGKRMSLVVSPFSSEITSQDIKNL
jgi:hypothetical protein